MKTLITSINMHREGDSPIFGESVTEIGIEDEAGGMFITVTQFHDDGIKELRFDLDEIDDLKKNLDYMSNLIVQFENKTRRTIT